MFLDDFKTEVPYEALNYLTAECNYGGRVTDGKDRVTIKTIMLDYYCQGVVEDPNYKFANDPIFHAPAFETHEEYLTFIKEELPIIVPPDVFGFH